MNKSDALFEGWLSCTKPVMPVIVIDDKEDAVPLAKALFEGGVKLLEVTLRTPAGLMAIEKMAQYSSDIVVGAGTVTQADQVDQVKEAGGRFVVSPGFSNAIAERTQVLGMAYLPGVATSTEIMMALEKEYSFLKFFPAVQAGGIDMIKAFSGPFPHVTFCPTGGINKRDYARYLALENVRCVGGSWLATKQLIQEKSWKEITTQAIDI